MNEVKAVTKYLRISPRKVNRLLGLVRGKGVREASAILKFMPHKGAKLAWETLKSAVANAKHNKKLKEEMLIVKEAYVGPGPTYKRYQPKGRGRIYSLLKRTCRITFVVGEKEAA